MAIDMVCVELWVGSVTDLKEATLCVEELRAFKQHPEMVYTWVSESLEKNDRERDLVVKLLLHLHRIDPPLLSHDQLEKGYGFFIAGLGMAVYLFFSSFHGYSFYLSGVFVVTI